MQCVIPLAGPQLTHPRHGLIPKYEVDGVPLLRRTIETRSWWKAGRLRGQDLIFVLREGAELGEIRAAVADWFPGSRTVTLSHVTRGAVLSALAGTALVAALDEPLIVDLADILYETEEDLEACFAADPSVGAIATYFEAHDACYSYPVRAGWLGRLGRREEGHLKPRICGNLRLSHGRALYRRGGPLAR